MLVLGILACKIVSLVASDSLDLLNPSPEREALRWVQKNIAQFGGDPAKVSL